MYFYKEFWTPSSVNSVLYLFFIQFKLKYMFQYCCYVVICTLKEVMFNMLFKQDVINLFNSLS